MGKGTARGVKNRGSLVTCEKFCILFCATAGLLWLIALFAVACTSTDRESAGDIDPDSTFTPTQYSVADFYANSNFFGGSFSPDRQRVLVGSNLSGIWNAYAVPAAWQRPDQFGKVRKSIARLKTVLREKEANDNG